jgi:prolyl-tRNA synthetase
MRYSRAFIPTVKEAPKDAQVPSHVLMLRAGYARQVGAGLYELLPLGQRVLRKIERVIREEMDASGAHEIVMPALLPAEYFEESGRWDSFGDNLLRLKDRKGARYHLGPTHEEIVTDLVRREVRSYKQLPLNLYQIQGKFRDEPRPRAGLLRCREFLMKDAYSFDATEERALESYAVMRETYHRIFKRLGLDYRLVQADSGAMGGSTSAEFQVLATTGEDSIVACTACDYAANVEVAVAAPAAAAAQPAALPLETVATPRVHTIEEVVAFLGGGLSAQQTLKALIYVDGSGTLAMALVRGDHEVNEIKLARALGAREVHLASDEDVRRATGAAVGFAGPVGFAGRIVADPSALAVHNAVTGANKTDAHLRNVCPGRDYRAEPADIRSVGEGDLCARCNAPLKAYRGIEGGHIFVLGTHYTEKMGARFLDETGEQRTLVMGCYGIGVSRLIAASIEQHHDADGILWPMALAPYQVMVSPLAKDAEVMQAAERVYAELGAAGVEVLLDDRDERAGVKFKDADLLGIPLRVTIGKRGLAEGKVELKARGSSEVELIALDDCAAELGRRIRAALVS